jgi:methionine-rich copper-binding protein CopC
MLRKKKYLTIFCLSWAVVFSTTAHAAFVQHAPVLGVAPAANTNSKITPFSAAVLIGEPNLGGSQDYLLVLDAKGTNHAGSISTSAVVESTKLTVPLTTMKPGWYAAHWNVQSEDGHMAGGDDGSWWAFGVRAVSPSAKTVKIKLRASVPVEPLPPSLTVSLNGRRTGMRTLTASMANARVTSFRFIRNNESPESLRGASFSWPVTYNKKTKLYSSTGIIRFAGSYTLTAQITSTNSGVTRTALWSGDVEIS